MWESWPVSPRQAALSARSPYQDKGSAGTSRSVTLTFAARMRWDMSGGPIVPMFMQCGVPLNAIRRWRLLLGIWACSLAMPAMRGVESAAPSVLILYSHDRSLPGNVRLEQGEIALIAGAAEHERLWRDMVKEEGARLGSAVKLNYWSGLPIAEVKPNVAKLPPSTAVLFLRYLRDPGGETTTAAKTATDLAVTTGTHKS